MSLYHNATNRIKFQVYHPNRGASTITDIVYMKILGDKTNSLKGMFHEATGKKTAAVFLLTAGLLAGCSASAGEDQPTGNVPSASSVSLPSADTVESKSASYRETMIANGVKVSVPESWGKKKVEGSVTRWVLPYKVSSAGGELYEAEMAVLTVGGGDAAISETLYSEDLANQVKESLRQLAPAGSVWTSEVTSRGVKVVGGTDSGVWGSWVFPSKNSDVVLMLTVQPSPTVNVEKPREGYEGNLDSGKTLTFNDLLGVGQMVAEKNTQS